jgi:hypothetical protein
MQDTLKTTLKSKLLSVLFEYKIMTKKVIIPDEIYERLSSLAALCKQDVDDVIVEILKAVGSNIYDINELRKSYGVPITIEHLMEYILEAGVDSSAR